MVLFDRLRESRHYKIDSKAILVLPAPVGAHTSKLSGVLKAAGYNFDWIVFKDVISFGNALCVH
jgi:hypothetical protein